MAHLGEQSIKCSVKSCKHNNKSNACVLSGITVNQEPPVTDAKNKMDTVCGSFEADML